MPMKEKWVRQRRVVSGALVASLAALVCGTVSAYTSPAMPDLAENTPVPFRPTGEQKSWISSVVSLGDMVGALLGVTVADRLGRQQTLVVATAPFFIGWVVIACSPSFAVMMVGRIITGIFKGLLMSTVGVYVSEIAPTRSRGMLGTCIHVFLSSGTLYTYVVGAFVPWNWLAIACGGILIIVEILLCFFPETPRWLAAHGYREGGISTLRWWRCTDDVDTEYSEIEESLKVIGKATPYRDFFRGPLVRPMIISQGLAIIQKLTGTTVIHSYTVEIFNDAGTDLDSNVESIIIGIVGVCGTVISALTVDVVGRRILYLVSTFGMTASMMATGSYFYVQSVNPEYAQSSLSWLPLTGIVGFNFTFALASGSLMNLVTCEMFPTEARQRANSFAGFTQALCGFVMTKVFNKLKKVIYEYGVFFLCGTFSFAGFVFVFLLLPEQKGKSLEELQQQQHQSPAIKQHRHDADAFSKSDHNHL